MKTSPRPHWICIVAMCTDIIAVVQARSRLRPTTWSGKPARNGIGGAGMRLLAHHLDGAEDHAVDVAGRDAGAAEQLVQHERPRDRRSGRSGRRRASDRPVRTACGHIRPGPRRAARSSWEGGLAQVCLGWQSPRRDSLSKVGRGRPTGAMATAGRRSAATDGQMAHGAVARSRYRTASHHPLEARKLLKLEAYRPNHCVPRWHASCLVAAVC